jgi:CspA family cold shock protein
MKGTIKKIARNDQWSINYGFIIPEDGSKDIFFHVSNLVWDVAEGDQVDYLVWEWRKGPEAQQVKKI